MEILKDTPNQESKTKLLMLLRAQLRDLFGDFYRCCDDPGIKKKIMNLLAHLETPTKPSPPPPKEEGAPGPSSSGPIWYPKLDPPPETSTEARPYPDLDPPPKKESEAGPSVPPERRSEADPPDPDKPKDPRGNKRVLFVFVKNNDETLDMSQELVSRVAHYIEMKKWNWDSYSIEETAVYPESSTEFSFASFSYLDGAGPSQIVRQRSIDGHPDLVVIFQPYKNDPIQEIPKHQDELMNLYYAKDVLMMIVGMPMVGAMFESEHYVVNFDWEKADEIFTLLYGGRVTLKYPEQMEGLVRKLHDEINEVLWE